MTNKPLIELQKKQAHLTVDSSSYQPPTKHSFQTVYTYIQTRIQRGDWQAHAKLPSVRQLAEDTGMHRLTIFKAYQHLKEDGHVYARDKSGYYVQPPALQVLTNEAELGLPLFQGNLGELHRIEATYQFSQALITPNLLPNHYFAEYVKQVFDLYPKLLGTYATAQGDLELREMLQRYFIETSQFHVHADEILITTGAQQAISLIAEVWIRPGDHVLIESPAYASALDVFEQKGAKLVPINIDANGYDLVQIEQAMKKYKPRFFYLNPTFHNPTGVCISAEQRKQLVDLAAQYKCLLIEDDTCYDIYFDQKPPLPLFAYDTEGYTIYIRSFSKYISPGLRIACIVARPEWFTPLLAAKSLADGGTPLLNQKVFLLYFTSNRLQQHIEKLRIALRIRLEIMEEELSSTGWYYESPQGGFNLWVRLPDHLSVPELLARCLKQSISFVPGSLFDRHEASQQYIRLCFSFASEHNIRQGIQQLVSIAKQMESTLSE